MELIERFRQLFIEAKGYSDPEVRLAIETLARSKNAEEDFKLILNRCCHIPINRWQMKPKLHAAIPELVGLFENTLPPGGVHSRGGRRVRQLVQHFKDSEQYLTLQRLTRVVGPGTTRQRSKTEAIGNLINRYPYLYEHCLLSDDCSYEHQQTVRQIKDRVQRRFELDLNKFVTYQVRLAGSKKGKFPHSQSERSIKPVSNPTLLSDRELGVALKHFVGKVDGDSTYRDLAQNFLTQSIQTPSYRDFKDELYEYLISSLDANYRKLQFNEKLYDYIKNTLPRYDYQKPNEFLLLRTSSKLLNFLVVESPHRPDHYIFVDMITNMGPTSTIAMLLKITLLCHQVKPHLEKRFSILFNHYESANGNGVPWLIQSLENAHIALSIHFGSADLSHLRQIL